MSLVNMKLVGQEWFIGKPDDYTTKIHDGILSKIVNIRKIRKRGWDSIILIDGPRRAGKSTLGMTIAHLLEPNLTIKNIGRGMSDAAQKIESLPDDGLLMIDEGSLVFNSKESMKKEQVKLMKIIDVVGQKRLVLIVILPSFFDLARPIAVTHSRFLLHVYTDDDLNRGFFAYFGNNTKRFLYEKGKKNYGSYAWPPAEFVGQFVDYNPLGQAYIELKKESLLEALHSDDKKNVTLKYKKVLSQRDELIRHLHFEQDYDVNKIVKVLEDCGQKLSKDAINKILKSEVD